MIITDECKLHLQTADLLLEGIKESMEELEKEVIPAPEHSVNSVSRRIVQVRQELLRVQQELYPWRYK